MINIINFLKSLFVKSSLGFAYREFLIALVFIGYSCISFAQHDTIKANQLIELAKSKVDSNLIEGAIQYYKDAAKLYRAHGKWERFYDCQYSMLYAVYPDRDYDLVIEALSNNLDYYPQEELFYKAKSFKIVAFVNDQIGNISVALDQYKKSLSLFEINDKHQNNESVLSIYANIGIIYTKLNDFDNIIKNLNRSLSIATKINSKKYLYQIHKAYGDAYFYNDNIAKAIEHYEWAQNIKPDNDGYYEEQMANVYLQLNNYDEAIRFGLASLRRREKINKYVHYANALLGDLYVEKGDFQSGLPYYQTAEKTFELDSDKREVAKFYFKFGNCYQKLQSYEKANKYYHKTLQILFPNDKGLKKDELPNLEYCNPEIWIVEVLAAKASIYRLLFDSSQNIEELELADQHNKAALFVIERIKFSYDGIRSKQRMSTIVTKFYEQSIKNSLQLFELTKDQMYLNQAFQFSEQYNSYSLREQIGERNTLKIIGVKEYLQKEYFNRKKAILDLNYQINNTYSDSLFQQIELANKRFNIIKDSIATNHPSFLKMIKKIPVPNVETIQKDLPESTALIRYFIGIDHIYTFVITSNDIYYKNAINNIAFDREVAKFRALLSNYEALSRDVRTVEKDFVIVSNNLYNRILKDVLNQLPAQISNLIIVPDHILSQIPFEALMVNKVDSWSNPSDFLLSKYNISYANFSSQLSKKKGKDKSNIEPIVSFGLEYDPYTLEYLKKTKKDSIPDDILQKFRSSVLSHLYFADDEAMSLAELFRGKAYLNELATKKHFLEDAEIADIIHISAHSYVDVMKPENSSIIFSKTDPNTDNLLKASDIYGLNLNSSLVTLSACNSSFGKNIKGEGLSSIAKAFIEAGSQSVVGSFWSVPDEITHSFMKIYYRKLKEGKNKSKALQETKMEYLSNDELSSPFYRSPAYWSSWVVFGNTEPIRSSQYNYNYLFLALIILALSTLIFGYYRRRKLNI